MIMCFERLWIKRSLFYSYQRFPQRYVFTFLGFFCMVSAFSMRACFNITITQMVRPRGSPTIVRNSSIACPFVWNKREEKKSDFVKVTEYFDWDEKTQGLLLSSFYYGYILTHIPGGTLAQRLGGKHTLGFGLLLSAILTCFTPWAARKGPYYVMALRFLEGVGEGTKFPAINHLIAQWAPPLERSKISTFVLSGALIGIITGISCSGFIIKYTGGWQYVFYTFGTVGFVWFILWTSLCYDNPSSHPFISDEEKIYLFETIGQLERKKDLGPTPWKHMMRSGPMWALTIAMFGHDWGAYMILTDLPKYMSDVLHFNITENSVLSALPSLASWIVSLVSSYFADWTLERKYMDVTTIRKLYATIAAVGPAVGVVLIPYAGCDQLLTSVIITTGIGLMGFCFAGLKVNTIDLSPNYSAIIMAVVNGVGCISGMLAPYSVGLLTPNRSIDEWKVAFRIMAAILVLSNLVFIFFGSAKVQYWNDLEEYKKRQLEVNRQEIPHLTTPLNE